ncbi:MAG: hypothetical protein M5U17_15160 [Ignavibacterium sp.]|nr:hypothetical protein [Ignavibacterium sp.]
MKSQKLSKKEKEEIERFGANTWFVESLYKQYEQKPDEAYLSNGRIFLVTLKEKTKLMELVTMKLQII